MIEKPAACKACACYYNVCLPVTKQNATNTKPAAKNLIVIGCSPPLRDVTEDRPFQVGYEKIVREIISEVQHSNSAYANIAVHYTYAVLAPVLKPSIEVIKTCKQFVQRRIATLIASTHTKPILLVLGHEALRALDHPVEKISSLFGKRVTVNIPTTEPGGTQALSAFVLPSVAFFVRNPGIKSMYAAVAQTALSLLNNPDTLPSTTTLTTSYQFPKTLADVRRVIDEIIAYYNPERSKNKRPEDWWISIDTETTGLHPQWLQNPKVTMVSVAWDTGKSATICTTGEDYTEEEAWQELGRLLSCPKPKVFHNAKFDLKFLELVHKKKICNLQWDSMLGEHFLDEDKKGFYGLKKLVPIYLPAYQNYEANIRFDSDDAETVANRRHFTKPQLAEAAAKAVEQGADLYGIENKYWQTIHGLLQNDKIRELKEFLKLRGMQLIPAPKKKKNQTSTADLITYAAIDADVTRQITKMQFQRAAAEQTFDFAQSVMQRLYIPASRVIGKMEMHGVRVNTALLQNMIHDAEARLERLQRDIQIKFDPTLNIRSPQQLAAYMSRANFPQLDETVTDKDTLQTFLSMFPPTDPRRDFCKLVLEYREVHKVLFTYLVQLRDHAAKNGRIHCNFHLNGTTTGRLSSSDPNMQNIPKIAARVVDDAGNVIHPGYNIKEVFIPSAPNMCIVNVDIKAAELRTYTAYAKDNTMISILLGGQDPHSWIAAQIIKRPYEEIVAKKESDPEIKTLRTNCKRIVFGTLYGAGPDKIAKILKIPKDEASALQQHIFNILPALRRYIDNVVHQIKTKRLLVTYFGRCRRFPITKYSPYYFSEAIREGVNFLIQSTSSDLVLTSLCNLDMPIEKLGGRLLFSVHDSIVLELPEARVSELPALLNAHIVNNIKENYPWLPVPFLYEAAWGENYGNLKEEIQ